MNTMRPILYAEDDENDAFFMQRAFRKLDLPYPLRIVSDGRLAIAYLSGLPPYANAETNPLPRLTFLDLSMPRQTGFQVLEWIQSQPCLATMPVVVLTSSNQEKDIARARSLGAKGYLVKPGEPDEFLQMVKAVHDYWLSNERPVGIPPGGFADVASNKPARPNSANC